MEKKVQWSKNIFLKKFAMNPQGNKRKPLLLRWLLYWELFLQGYPGLWRHFTFSIPLCEQETSFRPAEFQKAVTTVGPKELRFQPWIFIWLPEKDSILLWLIKVTFFDK